MSVEEESMLTIGWLLPPSEHGKDVEIALIRTVKYDWEGK